MIHFDFTLSDEDAQALMDLVQDGAVQALESALLKSNDEPTREWWRRRAVYLRDLSARMKNSRA